MSAHTPIKRRAIHILIVALALAATPVASAATPSWYSQLHLAVQDAGDAGTAIGTCAAPSAAKPKAGRSCSIVHASEESNLLDEVSVYTETGEVVGPCRRLLFKLDHTTTTAAAKALAFAISPTMTTAKEVSGRRALAQAASHVTADFAALQHCLGKS
jgi:hypothetical protein